MNTSEKRLSKLTLFAYGMGDFASNLCWTFIGSYLSVFYTDVVGMAPAIASAIMLIAKIWDGVNDPMFGAIAERTNTKRGRFRPYILFGAPILAVLSVLAFTTIGRGNAAVIYAAITYIGCGMAYTVVNLSYGSLSTVMTTNPEDIAQLNSWRMMGTNLSSVLLNAITAPLLMKFSGGSESYTAGAYTKVAILFAICALPLFYFVYVNCKETIKPVAGATKVSVGTSIKTVLSNKPLILVFFIQLLAMTAFFGRMGVVIYYLMYNVQRYDLIAAFMSLPSLFTVIGIFLTKNYIVKIGKKKMILFAFVVFSLAYFYTGFMGKISFIPENVQGLILMVVAALPMAIFGILPQAVVVDIAQSDAITSGSNREGMFYAARTFAFKLGQSLSMLIFTAVSTIGAGNGTGYRVAAFGAAVFCCVGGIILAFYNEKRINGIISGK